MAFLIGWQGGIYVADTVSDPIPTPIANWTEMLNVIDVSNNFDSESVDSTTRAEASKGWASEVNVIKNGEIGWGMRWDPADANFVQIRNAWLFTQEVGILDLDQKFEVSGAQGLGANMTVSFTTEKPVKDIQRAEVTARVSSAPDWYTSDGTAISPVTPP